MSIKKLYLKFLCFTFTFNLFFLFFSCETTTNVYKTIDDNVFVNESLASESHTFTKDDVVKEDIQKTYTSSYFTDKPQYTLKGTTVAESKGGIVNEYTKVQIFEGSKLYAQKSFTTKNGEIKEINDVEDFSDINNSTGNLTDNPANNPTENGNQLSEEKNALLYEALNRLSENGIDFKESSGNIISRTSETETCTVESTINGKYLTYSLLGKPFVIAGVTAWNIVKCTGYAFLNFACGYNILDHEEGEPYWMMPDVEAAKEKADAAREANRIVYPEYHKPFTNNHITVEKFTTETENAFSSSEQVHVIAQETREYDNTISVERSVEKDANATARVAGYIGTAVTVPISAITFVGGIVARIAYEISSLMSN